jgi:hypothetical protein
MDTNNSGSNSGSLLMPPENMMHPRDYSAPSSANDQSQGATNVIQDLSEDQIFNNSSQGSGISGPSVWGGPASMKATQSSADAGTKAGDGGSVDLMTGQNSCWNGGRAKG